MNQCSSGSCLIKIWWKNSRCFFFGDACAKRNPKLLLTYIFDLYDYFLKEFYCFRDVDNPKKSAIPLVINTSGWIKGEVSLLLPHVVLVLGTSGGCFLMIKSALLNLIFSSKLIARSMYNSGTGLHVLTEMLKYVSPTHVIRVSTTVEHKNLPCGTFWMNKFDESPPVNLFKIRAAHNSPRR